MYEETATGELKLISSGRSDINSFTVTQEYASSFRGEAINHLLEKGKTYYLKAYIVGSKARLGCNLNKGGYAVVIQ